MCYRVSTALFGVIRKPETWQLRCIMFRLIIKGATSAQITPKAPQKRMPHPTSVLQNSL
eukprot:m.381241 g.381241  ORF g.381241 m.381241 type:complete len:59 (-) comp110600_c0_seq1:10-186(-)